MSGGAGMADGWPDSGQSDFKVSPRGCISKGGDAIPIVGDFFIFIPCFALITPD
jgi:hypothetical protein